MDLKSGLLILTVQSCLNNVRYSTYHSPIGLHGLFGDDFTFLYLDDVRTSQDTYL
jgi:hypothetical protein